MQLKKVLIAILVLLSIVFLSLQLLQYEIEAAGARTLLLFFLTALYCHTVKTKRFYFFMFLVTFTISEILNFTSWFILLDFDSIDYFYYIGNGLYILSYIFLIIQVLKTMNIREVVTKFPLHIIILLVLDVFCVLIVTSTTRGQLSYNEYALEFLYNAVIMLLLSLALINYIYRDDKKSMNLLVGSIFIVFSEVIQLAYFYISEINFLNVLCSLLLVIAFLFFYLQARLNHEEKEYRPISQSENLKA
ncbi:hypothetical protein A9Q87_00780 [Flavobacteriales bacterium 34_180_T64]|nr:hypothetical protein A9Q87_00780 [Flavobacteriales bacterium 34_180_T64]